MNQDIDRDTNETPFENAYQLWSLCGMWAFAPLIFLMGIAMRDWRVSVIALLLFPFLLATQRTRFMIRYSAWFKLMLLVSCLGQLIAAATTVFAPLKLSLNSGLALFLIVLIFSASKIPGYVRDNNITG